MIKSANTFRASASLVACDSFSIKARCLCIACCANSISWLSIESKDDSSFGRMRRGDSGNTEGTESLGKCSICDTGRVLFGVTLEDCFVSCPEFNGGVGSAFGGNDCGAIFGIVVEGSPFAEKGGVCAYSRAGPAGLGSGRGVEKAEWLEKSPVEEALGRELRN